MTDRFRPTFVLLPALALALPPAARRQEPTPAQVIDRASKAFSAARTVKAGFEQTLVNPATGTESKATGELVLQQPNRVSVRFTQPAGDRVIGDGSWLWVYLPSAAPNQVIKLPAKGKGVTGVDALGDLLTQPRARYNVAGATAATVGGRATRVVTLTPKSDGQPIDRARVWVDDADASVRQVELTDANGLVRTLRMTSWTLNASVPASTFKFDVPAGARVVDRSTLVGGR
ncbi:outer membrane lipoprotein carrier protein LolA [Roseisolibacter sp. H3M3-2]|uniref:LolA family protein n=1 Tax=Roseisolibacter sp. H3M3-2 TaxID=3031323 RepID=UPI0023DA2A86|nr:outer membrane lipoprotein carrier protein LolA [Roseisolibacter sp. H3M3-2]MDF1505175.1 outer membrane lipoprotein carrier protein LolA [Roseisolibacter sp. H3M3-2]